MDRCPIEEPHFCLGYRCQLTGVCDFNRRMREKQDRLSREGMSQFASLDFSPIKPTPLR